jgi:2-methylcitrate dehydratase
MKQWIFFSHNWEFYIMQETIAEYLAAYSQALRYEDLPKEVVQQTKMLLIDTLACAMGGYSSEPSRIARSLADRIIECDRPASIFGSNQKTTPELATFANGVMIRYLDFNDSYFSREGGHPSDAFAALLSCSDAVHSSGEEFIVATVLAYEVFCRLTDRYRISPQGFDHAITGVISAVLGVSKLLGLSEQQMIQAVNLAVAPNIALGQTRKGEVSMWKGAALANAGRNAVFAALLAQEGMTGPSPIFEGYAGFFNAVSGDFSFEPFGGDGQPFRILDVMIKRYPCGAVAQSAIEAAILLRKRVADIDEIAEVHIGTFHFGKTAMASDPEKWHPKTRESADHSIPYVVAVALKHGAVELGHFDEACLNDPEMIDLVQRIVVEETKECNDLYPESYANRVEIKTTSGEMLSELVRYHRGHPRNPLSEKEIEQKFYSLVDELLSEKTREEILVQIRNLEKIDDIGNLVNLFNIEG